MRQKQTIKYLQRPKRIRKSKKDFLRGNREIVESKVHYENTIVPLPYVLLFSLLAATIIGYTSINFLFARIHIDVTPLFSFIKASLFSIHLPHITIPTIIIPIPRIPEISMPPIHVSSLLELAMQNAALLSLNVILAKESILMPAFAGMTKIVMTWAWTSVSVFTAWTIKTVQTNSISLAQSIHPGEIIQMGLSALGIFVIATLKTIGNGSIWIYGVLGDYIVLVGQILSTSRIFLLQVVRIAGTFLLQAVVLSTTKLMEITATHLSILLQTIATTIVVSSTLVINCINFIFQAIISFLAWQRNTVIYVTTITLSNIQALCMFLLHGILLVFKGTVYILTSILKFIVSILVIILDWIVSIIMAIKRGIDTTLTSIGAFIHLGDPLYKVIGSSINDLFASMGATASITGKVVEGGKL